MSLSCNCYVISVFQQCNVELVMCSSMKCNLFINLKLSVQHHYLIKLSAFNLPIMTEKSYIIMKEQNCKIIRKLQNNFIVSNSKENIT
jgi:hypothetical protein